MSESESVNVISDKMLALVHDATNAAYNRACATEWGRGVKAAILAEKQTETALVEAIAELEAENARLKAEQAAPKKDASELISGLDRASLALDALENLLKAEQAEPKVEYNLKVKPSIGFCSERAAKLIDNLGNAAWYYGHSCSFENYTAQIEADAALCDFVARLERRENDLNELLEIVRVIAEYRSSEWTEEAVSAMDALEKFLNKERQ